MVKKDTDFRVIKFKGYGKEHYVIERKFLWTWLRFSDADFSSLEEALRVIEYHTAYKEQVWP